MTEAANEVLVVAVDFSTYGDDALHMALSMLAGGQAKLVHLVHVLDPRDVIDAPEQPALLTQEEVVARAPARLVERARVLASLHGLPFDARAVHGHARIGRAVPTLIQVCVDYEADLLVLGTHGRRGVERLLLGSVAEALVREAPCPVLVARPRDYASRAKTALPEPPYRPGEAPVPSEVPFERTTRTELDSWRPSDAGPTGMRIV